MKTSDLRIGNWVKCKGNDIDSGEEISMDCQIKSIPNDVEADYKYGVEFPSEDNCSVEPITLTPEWLERSGAFETDRGPHAYQDFEIIKAGEYWAVSVDGEQECIEIARIKYVHEWQNLMRWLAGTELEIKTEKR